jgi:hypothetical protein
MSSTPQDEARRATESDTFSVDERTLFEPDDEDGHSHGKPSTELSDGDHDILESEDERERLLTEPRGANLFKKSSVMIGKRESTKASVGGRRKLKGSQNAETNALMYEMEEGAGVSNSSLSRHSSDSDEQRLLAARTLKKARPADYGASRVS